MTGTYSPFRVLGDTRGLALFATIATMVLISVLAIAAVSGVRTIVQTARVDYGTSQVFFAAEAGAEAVMAQMEDALKDGKIENREINALTPPDLPGFEFEDFDVSTMGDPVVERITDGPYAGLYALTQTLDIRSEAYDLAGHRSSLMVTAKAQAIPTFQFGVFFEKDLEATNGPPMEFGGWVHSNGNIYLSTNNAWYRDAITTPQKVFWDRKDAHSQKPGVFIDNAVGDEIQLDFDSRSHADPNLFRAASNAKFDDRLKTDAYGVDPLRVPLPEGMDPPTVMDPRSGGDPKLAKESKFAWKADWYIEVDLDDSDLDGGDPTRICKAFDKNDRPGGKQKPNNDECAAFFRWQSEGWYERREGRHADVLEIDLGELFDWSGGDADKQVEILYVTFVGGGQDPTGDGVYPVVRLVNGSVLGNPFTVATDHPLYVLGDYNTGMWQPASLVGDALTLLSNSWNDADNQIDDLPKPWASNTSVNAAVLAGHSATPCDHEVSGCPGGNYGGGIENFLRFLERWSGVTMTYRGSLISFSEARKATGLWGGGYYSPPIRDWQFDTRFEDPMNLPPGTPLVGNMVRTGFRPVY